MTERIKPFPYDAVETDALVIFIFASQGADGRKAEKLLAQGGLQLNRADGTTIRLINLHPRLQQVLQYKPTLIIEVGGHKAIAYAAGDGIQIKEALEAYFPETFYWYIGPETASIEDVAGRPFAQLVSQMSHRTIAVAPGETISGPVIGLSLSKRGILPLAPHRHWSRVASGLIIDTRLAFGTTSGFPANDNIQGSVKAAHTATLMLPEHRPRRLWSSQLAAITSTAAPQKDPELT